MRIPTILSGLLLALPLASCGDSPKALNDQGFRALRFDAVIDAEYFFGYAREKLAASETPDDLEAHRTRVGELALGAWKRPREAFEELRMALAEEAEALGPADLAVIAKEYLDARRALEALVVLEVGLARSPVDPDLARLEDDVRAAAEAERERDPGASVPSPEDWLAGRAGIERAIRAEALWPEPEPGP